MVKRRSYTKEFKLSILQELEHKPISQLSREHEIHPSLISRWQREQQDYPKEAFKGRGNLYKLESKVAQYERLIGQLYAEIDLLKKTNFVLKERSIEERRKYSK